MGDEESHPLRKKKNMHIPIMSTYGVGIPNLSHKAMAGSLSYEEIMFMYFYNPL